MTDIELLNPAERFKFDDEEMARYLAFGEIPGEDEKKSILDYRRSKNVAIRNVYKGIVFSWKDGGKSHFLHTISELDERFGNKKEKSGVKYDPLLGHVKHLLENGHLKRGSPQEYMDAEGKGDILSLKFKGYPIRYRDLFYKNGPMPTIQDPVAFMKELTLWIKSIEWAHNNPEKYNEYTRGSKYPKGLKSPNSASFENYSIKGNEIMNYVRTMSHDDKADKLIKKGQELGAPIIKKFDNWDIRNCNWDYMGGLTQRLPVHYVASARARKKWVNSEPTDEDDIALYSQATYAFNFVLYLWRDVDKETGEIEFWGQIMSSDFMDRGMVLKPIRDPSYPKVVSLLSRYSHANILDKNGIWEKVEINGKEEYIWKEVKTVKNVKDNDKDQG